jgi:hypothetical protein
MRNLITLQTLTGSCVILAVHNRLPSKLGFDRRQIEIPRLLELQVAKRII